MSPLSSFDPTSLLDDSEKELFSEKSLQQLKNHLKYKLLDYLTIRLSQYLTEEQLSEVLNTATYIQRVEVLKKYISIFDQKAGKYIEEFKKAFTEKE